jgi:hypothetical protein
MHRVVMQVDSVWIGVVICVPVLALTHGAGMPALETL